MADDRPALITIRRGLSNVYFTVTAEEYKRRGANLMMAGVDRMAPELRQLVHEFGPYNPPKVWSWGARGDVARRKCEEMRKADEREAHRSAGIKL